MSISQQIHRIQLKHLLLMTMYNLLLSNLMCYNCCRLPMAVQLGPPHELMLPHWCLMGECSKFSETCAHIYIYVQSMFSHTIQSRIYSIGIKGNNNIRKVTSSGPQPEGRDYY